MFHHIDLHKKYGPLVRTGPNHVSFSDASLIPQIYGITSKFYKSDFYSMSDIKTPAGPMATVFSARDEKVHKSLRRPIAHAYALSSLKELEPMNDECSAIFLKKLEGLVGRDVDLGKWVHVSSQSSSSWNGDVDVLRSGMLSTQSRQSHSPTA